MTIGVVGLGNWGTALAQHLAANGHKVIGWSSDSKIVEGINQSRLNPRYQREVALSENMKATSSIEDLVGSSFLIIALPSHALADAVKLFSSSSATALLSDISSSTVVVSAVKGLEHDTLQTPLQFLAANLKGNNSYVVLSGPSFATDVANCRPVGVVAASVDEEAARSVAELFSIGSMRVYISVDPIGVEVGGVCKNVVALAAGVCDGMQLGDSARAGLITRGLAEITRLAVAMGAERQTLSGLAGLGDLAMTASSLTSRNYTVGYRLGKGESLEVIVKTLGSVAEGVISTPLVLRLAKQHCVEMPIAEVVNLLLEGKISPRDLVHRLLSRPMKREF